MIHYRNKKKKFNLFFIVAVVLVVIFSITKIFWPQNFSKFLFTPAFSFKEFIINSSGSIGTSFKDKEDLENKVFQLEEENSKLKIAILSQNFANSQAEDYKIELEKKQNGAVLKVLNRPPFSPYDTLLILKEENDIEVGDLVFTRGVYIGNVENVSSRTATIKLRSSSGEKTLVRVSGIEVDSEGRGGGQFLIKIPKDSEIKIGDAVVVPDLNYSIIGSVGQIVEDPVATFKSVYFSIPIAFQDMNFVSVVKKESVLE